MDCISLDLFSADVRCLQFGSDTCVQSILRIPGNKSGDCEISKGRINHHCVLMNMVSYYCIDPFSYSHFSHN